MRRGFSKLIGLMPNYFVNAPPGLWRNAPPSPLPFRRRQGMAPEERISSRELVRGEIWLFIGFIPNCFVNAPPGLWRHAPCSPLAFHQRQAMAPEERISTRELVPRYIYKCSSGPVAACATLANGVPPAAFHRRQAMAPEERISTRELVRGE